MRIDPHDFQALQDENAKLEKEVITLRESASRLEEKVASLTEQLDYFLRRAYGRKSERFEQPGQLDFFPDLLEEARAAAKEEPEPEKKVETKRSKRKKPGPAPIPDHLPRDIVPWDPSEEERTCACCDEAMERIDEVVFEELTVTPPEFRVKRYVRGKWRCESCMSGTISKELPPRPIEKGRPSPSLLAYIIVSKWVDHVPLHRQEQIFARYSYALRRQTMNDWLGAIAELLRPIVDAMKRWLLALVFLQSDDTRIQYLDRETKGKSRRGYLWSYGIPRGEVVYQLRPDVSGGTLTVATPGVRAAGLSSPCLERRPGEDGRKTETILPPGRFPPVGSPNRNALSGWQLMRTTKGACWRPFACVGNTERHRAVGHLGTSVGPCSAFLAAEIEESRSLSLRARDLSQTRAIPTDRDLHGRTCPISCKMP